MAKRPRKSASSSISSLTPDNFQAKCSCRLTEVSESQEVREKVGFCGNFKFYIFFQIQLECLSTINYRTCQKKATSILFRATKQLPHIPLCTECAFQMQSHNFCPGCGEKCETQYYQCIHGKFRSSEKFLIKN